MSKLVDTYTRFKNNLQNLFSINKSVPSGLGNKGILKDDLLDMASPEIDVEWTKEFIPPDKAIIDEDYVLSRYPLSVSVKDKIVYTDQEGGVIGGSSIMNAIKAEAIGGVPPYTYSWSVPASTVLLNGQGTFQIGVEMQNGPFLYSPFTCAVTDSANTTEFSSGSIRVLKIPTGQTQPPDREGPSEIVVPNPLHVLIRVPEEGPSGYRKLEGDPLIVVGGGTLKHVELVPDVSGGKPPYTTEWSVNQDVEGITTNHFGATISLDKGLGIYRVVLSAEDSLGITGSNIGYIYYQDAQGNLETIGSDYLYLPEKCSGKYDRHGAKATATSIRPQSFSFDMGTGTGACGIHYDFTHKLGTVMAVWDGRVVWFNDMSGTGTGSYIGTIGTITLHKNKSYPTVLHVVFMSDDHFDNNINQGSWNDLRYNVTGICTSGGHLDPDTSHTYPLSVIINNGQPLTKQGVMVNSGHTMNRVLSVPVLVSGGTGIRTYTDSIVNQSHPGVFTLGDTTKNLGLPNDPPNGAWCTYRVTAQDALTTVSSEIRVTYQKRI